MKPTTAHLNAELARIANDPMLPLASIAVAVVRDDKIIYKNAIGAHWIHPSDPSQNKAANTETRYRIASISKLITTLGVQRLVDEGKFRLDDDVSTHLGFRLRNPHFPETPITVRMLLNHTSSLRDDAGYFFPEPATLESVLLPGRALYGEGKMWDRNAPPGAYFSYANLPYGVLAQVMERASGERFDQLMQRLIFAPLDIEGGFNPAAFSKDVLANTATLYRKAQEENGTYVWEADKPWVPQVDDYSANAPISRASANYQIGSNGTLFSPQGGARLSVTELVKIAQLILNRGSWQGKPLIRAARMDEMLNETWRYDAQHRNGDNADAFNNAWGLSVQHFLGVNGGHGRGDRLLDRDNFRAVGHVGLAYGLMSTLLIDRVRNTALIVLIGGVGRNPDEQRGEHSALTRSEELILRALDAFASAPD